MIARQAVRGRLGNGCCWAHLAQLCRDLSAHPTGRRRDAAKEAELAGSLRPCEFLAHPEYPEYPECYTKCHGVRE
jgi:hypothetical protein